MKKDKKPEMIFSSCLYPTIQLDFLCQGCPVFDECPFDEMKGIDMLYPSPKAKKRRRK